MVATGAPALRSAWSEFNRASRGSAVPLDGLSATRSLPGSRTGTDRHVGLIKGMRVPPCLRRGAEPQSRHRKRDDSLGVPYASPAPAKVRFSRANFRHRNGEIVDTNAVDAAWLLQRSPKPDPRHLVNARNPARDLELSEEIIASKLASKSPTAKPVKVAISALAGAPSGARSSIDPPVPEPPLRQTANIGRNSPPAGRPRPSAQSNLSMLAGFSR